MGAAEKIALSKTELAAYLRAYTRKKQIRVLVSNGIRHHLDAGGWPIVTRSVIEGETSSQQPAKRWASNKARA